MISVISFNIHKGFSTRNRFTLAETRDACAASGADIIFLQEVVGSHRRHAKRIAAWPTVQQCDYVADVTFPYRAYGLNATYVHSDHGNGILSRFPITYQANVNLSTNRFEQRGCLHAILSLPHAGGLLHCLCVHLNLLHRCRLTQVMQLCERIRGCVPDRAPFVLAGDFNDWNGRLTTILEKEIGAREVFLSLYGKHAASYPSRYPLIRLDRIYSRGLIPVSGEVLTAAPWSHLSDHAPLRASFSTAVTDNAPSTSNARL